MNAPAPPPTGPAPIASGGAAGRSTPRRRLVADRVATWAIRGGGMAIVLCILGILAFILIEVGPLATGASVAAGPARPFAGGTPGAVLTDEYGTFAALVGHDGRVRVIRLDDGTPAIERALIEGPDGEPVPLVAVPPASGPGWLAGATDDGRIAAIPVVFRVGFEGSTRRVTPALGEPVTFDLSADGIRPDLVAVRLEPDGSGVVAAQRSDDALVVLRREVRENALTGEMRESWSRHVLPLGFRLGSLVLDPGGSTLYGGASDGRLVRWRPRSDEPPQVHLGESGVSALALLLGGRSLVVGRDDGRLEIWFGVGQSDRPDLFTRIREFPAAGGAIRLIAPSPRQKSFLAQDSAGGLGLYHSTSRRTLWRGESPLPGATALAFAPKADGAMLADARHLATARVSNPHPEVSLGALFGRVWYEGYDRPAFVWQSSGGSDEFEPKLSLVPLMAGTLKGTSYSLVLAIPLGVLGAMYASQFMHPGLRRIVKPTVEIMAALPSVVLGFLAGLWLAPRLAETYPALLLMLVLLPAIVLALGLAWRTIPARFRSGLPGGIETGVYALGLLAGGWLALRLNDPLTRWLFDGDFARWLLDSAGLQIDQRNAVVVGLAMGFAVIPIIFTIAEDAFSNVPRNLVAASLAVGANRWQTVTRVVLPTASPGIFSGVMIGFGRAVGETMIVLMATGNTPILDFSPWNGFRTLSANIAVEIPEAPQGGTLYRTLFLAALILFAFTFLLNTAAEIVRQRLRRRYAQL